MERPTHRTSDELLREDRYTPEEVAELLWPEGPADLLHGGLDVVRHAAFSGELRALIVGHDIVSIHRDDLLAWLEVRGDRARARNGRHHHDSGPTSHE